MTTLARIAQGALEATWLSAIVLIPLFVDKLSAYGYDPSKASLLHALAAQALAAWGIKALATGTSITRHALVRYLRLPLVAAALALLGTALLSSALSIAPAESFWGYRDRAYGLLTLLAQGVLFAAITVNLETQGQLQRLLSAWILPSIPIVAYAFAQRLGLEPLHVTWRETDIERTSSLLGQPVFLGAYLDMVVPFTALRMFEAWRAAPRRTWSAFAYAVLTALQLTAIATTESRGPLLGLILALALALLVIAAWRGRRAPVITLWLLVVAAALGIAAGAPARLASTLHGTALERVATRAANAFVVDGNGGEFRTSTWKVAQRLVLGRVPLTFSDDSRDDYAQLRSVVGYGPDTQYGVAPPYYDASLPKTWGYFLVDRFHNLYWDVLATTGGLGLAALLALHLSLLWMLLRQLRLVERRARSYWVWLCIGVASSSLGWVLAHGTAFGFLGLQLGLVLGLALFLSHSACSRVEPLATHAASEHRALSLALWVACLTHPIETSFSFAVVPTGCVFWLLCALVCVIASRELVPEPEPRWRYTQTIRGGVPTLWALMSLGYTFIAASSRPFDTSALLWDSLTVLSPNGTRVPVVAWIALSALVGGTALSLTAAVTAPLARRAIVSLGVVFAIASGFWIVLASQWTGLDKPAADPSLHVTQQFALRSVALCMFYVAILAANLVFAYAQMRAQVTEVPQPANRPAFARGLMCFACVLVAGLVVQHLALAPARANAALALGNRFDAQRNYDAAERAYRLAGSIMPNRSLYTSALAKAYTHHARIDPADAVSWLERARQTQLHAIELNPIAGENATNLALVSTLIAQHTKDQRPHFLPALLDDYARALRLNPMDPTLVRQWALIQFALLHDPSAALASLARAQTLAEPDAATSKLAAACYAARARAARPDSTSRPE